MTISVLQEDIDKGVVCSPARCPLARALSRSFGYQISVAGGWARKSEGSFLPAIRLPQTACRFEATFDAEEPVFPITFDLDLPDQSPVAPSASPVENLSSATEI